MKNPLKLVLSVVTKEKSLKIQNLMIFAIKEGIGMNTLLHILLNKMKL
jgi:hypothetical protein